MCRKRKRFDIVSSGGEKFVVNDLFFKYPIDKQDEQSKLYMCVFILYYFHVSIVNKESYGVEEANNQLAAKSCNNDIKGTVWIIWHILLFVKILLKN